MQGAIKKAEELLKKTPNSFMPQQFCNSANPDVHRKTTAKEILEATKGNLDAFVAGVGTGGTITGVGEVLKKHNPKIKIIAVEPENSAVLSGNQPGSHKIQGIGAGFVPDILNRDRRKKVMFKLPEEVENSVNDFKSSLENFINGKINSARFTGIRVPWGTYSHRGGKIFMNRIRITAGQISPKQLKAVAFAVRAYGNSIIHLTIRQDIQIHAVKLEDTIKVIEYLNNYDLSPRGGGGNTVRNITACPLSGICKNEVFEVNDYAAALTEYLLRQDTSFNMPRKLKISFSGCAKNCSGCLVNDVGILAEERNKEKGFKVFAGGGMGAEPILGALLEDFIPESDLGYCVQAIKNVFYKKGDRKNKHHNCLRFLIKDLGFDNFKKIYEEELRFLRSNEYIVLRKTEAAPAVSVKAEIPDVADEEFKGFLEYSAVSQKQDGLISVELRIPRGDLSADNLEALADLEICNINKSDFYKLFLEIKDSFHNFLYAQTLLDVVCCKGALTCNLGLCNSPSLTEGVEKVVKDNFIGKPVFKKLNIKINGCPNACGQHPIGLIALLCMAW